MTAAAPTIPCFVISLPDCTARRAAIRRRLHGLGIPFGFLDAVDGRQGLPPEYESQIDRVATHRLGRLLADADYACALSHIKAYRRIVAAGIPHALVLEDDALPEAALPTYLAGKHYEDAWVTQVYVGSYPYVRWTGAKRLFANYTSHVLAPILRGGAVAYIVSCDAARHFVDRALPAPSGLILYSDSLPAVSGVPASTMPHDPRDPGASGRAWHRGHWGARQSPPPPRCTRQGN